MHLMPQAMGKQTLNAIVGATPGLGRRLHKGVSIADPPLECLNLGASTIKLHNVYCHKRLDGNFGPEKINIFSPPSPPPPTLPADTLPAVRAPPPPPGIFNKENPPSRRLRLALPLPRAERIKKMRNVHQENSCSCKAH